MASVMCNIMILFFILSSLYEECLSVRFKVLSISSVSVTLGVDVVIPCCLTPEMDATGMEIRWFKTRFQPYVHLYHNGKEDYSVQRPEFMKRTELLKENITRGVFPLMIHNVTAQDSGEYHCFVESSDHHGRAKVQLQVTAVGGLPIISSITDNTLYCESRGWFPAPYVTWTDHEGNKINSSIVKVLKDENHLYHISSVIQLSNTSNITCTVSNSLNQSKHDSWQFIGRRLPKTSRDTRSHFHIISSSIILILSGCVFLLLMCFGASELHIEKLQNEKREFKKKNEELQSIYEKLQTSEYKSLDGRLDAKDASV
ncbi:butyrophilin-like protein 10 [Xenopus laevis]|uniref:Butyrophilin-like protein 10 n=2 Tax=Xenopus laevis TaxID=8355 RepID=A0A1L8FCJ3_XENLA|nr:butyrophilin-like protein 10 [Xenopus laevis]XP_018086973.2 butyrophilin-like protein 10 [Xenopus laevis]OCT69288.1 hypothetical protein XELAEV_18040600mg [Xenopus laevis]